MHVEELNKTDRLSLKRFAGLERELLGMHPMFVSNLDEEMIRHLTGNSPVGRRMNCSLFIAADGPRDVARCAAMINPQFQAAKHESIGFIGYFSAAPACESGVADLLGRAEAWLKAQGVTRIIAPFNGSPLLGYGVLVDAFDEEPVIFAEWNPPYYAAYFTGNGYRPTYPMFVYTFDFASPAYREAKERAKAGNDISIRPLDKKHWESELEIFRTVTNDNFTHEWLWYPIPVDEFVDFFEVAKPVFDPGQMMVAEVNGKPAGTMIGFPNWNPLARGMHGKTGNLQKLIFYLRGRKYANAGVMIAAVSSEFRGRGIGVRLELAVLQHYEEQGLKNAYCYTVDEDNLASRKMNEEAGGVPRRLYVAYDKVIGV